MKNFFAFFGQILLFSECGKMWQKVAKVAKVAKCGKSGKMWQNVAKVAKCGKNIIKNLIKIKKFNRN